MNRPSRQSGSALFIILIAIVIFSALSYAVFRGGGASTAMLTDEQARLAAQDIIAYGDTLAKTVQTLKLRGCADNQYSFANTSWKTHDTNVIYATNHNLTSTSNCNVFTVGVGNAQATVFPANYMFNWTTQGPTSTEIGHSRIFIMALPGIGDASREDLVYQLPIVKLQVCRKINDILGVTNPTNNVPNAVQNAGDYDGTFPGTRCMTNALGEISGKTAFCMRDSTDGQDVKFTRVLLTR